MIITTGHGEIHSNLLTRIHHAARLVIRGMVLQADPVQIPTTDMIAARRLTARREAVVHLIVAVVVGDRVQVHHLVPDQMEERGAGIK